LEEEKRKFEEEKRQNEEEKKRMQNLLEAEKQKLEEEKRKLAEQRMMLETAKNIAASKPQPPNGRSLTPARTQTHEPAAAEEHQVNGAKEEPHKLAAPEKKFSPAVTSALASPLVADKKSHSAPNSPAVERSTSEHADQPAASPVKTGGSKSRIVAPPKCAQCGKGVYPLEQVQACEKIWHKTCFRCKQFQMQTLQWNSFIESLCNHQQ
jgi:hypothetical protein